MATEQNDERLLDHSYDGIQEFDNPLPRWWVWIFWATIAFALLYVFDFTGRIRGPGRIKEYQMAMAAMEKSQPVDLVPVSDSMLIAIITDPVALADGKTTFTSFCFACHAPDGGGGIGPNLTDEYWIHGDSLTGIRQTVIVGVLEKGMPGWEKILKPAQLNNVVAYVASLRGTTAVAPKPPQGERRPPR